MDQRDHDYARHMAKDDHVVVFRIRQDSACSKCAQALPSGSLLRLQDGKAFCMACGGLDQMEFLPAGDPALTRRATKRSARKAVVVEWSRPGKRYERRGTLLEPSAIVLARQECLADADKRQAKQAKAAVSREIEDRQYLADFTAELERLFPSCPPAEAAEISQHACEKYSGRVGRSAGAKELEPDKIRLAVIAHIRHVHTGYDQFFDINVRKADARRMVQAKIQRVLSDWMSPRGGSIAG
jgi:hypothetical protein